MSGLIITSDKLSRSRSFSPAVKAGPFVYVSGTAPFDASKDIEGQTAEVFEYISQVLDEVNYSLQDVVKVQAFISSAEYYSGYNRVRRKYFPVDPPASTTVVAQLALKEWLVEVEVVAYKE
jgi:enamine deaminase RidA (YjgF/YER057c/UK114 family)